MIAAGAVDLIVNWIWTSSGSDRSLGQIREELQNASQCARRARVSVVPELFTICARQIREELQKASRWARPTSRVENVMMVKVIV